MGEDGDKMNTFVETGPDMSAADISRFEHCNLLLEKILETVLRTDDPDEGLNSLLAQLGQQVKGDRSYIFEVGRDNLLSNTWEWCAEGIAPQKSFLQEINISDIKSWFDLFNQNETVYIRDVEEIRDSDPIAYTILKPQQIHSLLAGRICQGNRVVGFIGVDNPAPEFGSILPPRIDPFVHVLILA